MRVAIIPTGRMEWEGLSQALAKLFSDHEFYSLPTPEEVATQEDIDFPAHSFTSCNVTCLRGSANNADKLIQRAAAEAVGDRSRRHADLVLIIDDLEIDNLHQPGAVVSIVREAAQRYIDSLSYNQQARARHIDALRTRVSFHIFKPMVEGWLFADPKGPLNAGVPSTRAPILLGGIDPEDFETNDTQYDADTGSACSCWHALPDKTTKQKATKRKHRPQWLRAGQNRRLHPKAYISWLCLDPTEKACSTYSETGGGAAALRQLDWASLLANSQHACFARSLVHDIAQALGVPPLYAGQLAPETEVKPGSQTALLRNL